jgi:uncharacterized protein YlzI (FlbEa/FlbD family)
MMFELTNVIGNLPIFINLSAIEAVIQLEETTKITFFSGKEIEVVEAASDIMFEIQNMYAPDTDIDNLH